MYNIYISMSTKIDIILKIFYVHISTYQHTNITPQHRIKKTFRMYESRIHERRGRQGGYGQRWRLVLPSPQNFHFFELWITVQCVLLVQHKLVGIRRNFYLTNTRHFCIFHHAALYAVLTYKCVILHNHHLHT